MKSDNATLENKWKLTDTFFDNLPPNHNHLIGLLNADTLWNVYSVVSLLQELTMVHHEDELRLSKSSAFGMHLVMCNIMDALKFEVDYRLEEKEEGK